ncbi:MAG: inositol monophosphatase family protein [Rhodoluna sp.]
MFSYSEDLALALKMANVADAISLPRFKTQDFKIETKPDSTPVTEADRAVEAALKEMLLAERSGDGIIGEEYGSSGEDLFGKGSRTWVIDPIDGTANYMRGVPVWATLIALAIDGKPLLSVVSAPAMGRRWWATPEIGAWTKQVDGEITKLQASSLGNISHASMSYVSLKLWDEIGLLDNLMNLARKVWRTRAFGDFWSYMLLAEGAIDFTAEHGLQIYDIAALVPIVEQAGGRITDFTGELTPESSMVLASNGLLHEEVRAYLVS